MNVNYYFQRLQIQNRQSIFVTNVEDSEINHLLYKKTLAAQVLLSKSQLFPNEIHPFAYTLFQLNSQFKGNYFFP